jgi:isoleucyl-tRNA synthetase
MSDDNPARDYRDTVFLPKTEFPMKAGLPQKEPGIAARWQEIGLYDQLRESRRGREKFIFHDGPPYANGDMHIGHALNHILKDMVCRTQNLIGKDAPYVPGWDCHGLPIEWKVEEQYRKEKKPKPVLSGAGRDEAAVKAFRDECRAYAQHWVDVQRSQLKRLGIMADWDHPYLTMQKESEAVIVAELLKLAEAGNLYRGSKPVMWSPVEQTALAEAEVEYEDITSTQIDVAFQIDESPVEALVGAFAVIWTTTPWTIPVNQAIAYGPAIEYVLGMPEFVNVSDEAMRSIVTSTTFNELFVRPVLIASELVSSFVARVNGMLNQLDLGRYGSPDAKFELVVESRFKGADLAGTLARHPMHHLGGFYAAPRPLLPGDFVTTDSGTGLVHMAPDHGEDDFELCKANGINPVFAVMDDGRYRDDWPWLGGADERRMSVINPKFNAPDGPICSDLREAGALLAASADYEHSYPHSWRSKAKVIFRCTPQWFVPMDKPLDATDPAMVTFGKAMLPVGGSEGQTLRETALAEIARVKFIPEKGRNRIGAMVEGRPDWVLSRQRAWGVPITLFVRPDGTYLQDPAVNARIVAAVNAEGMDAWNSANKAAFLGPDHDPAEFEMVTDILDVWFDSGCTHAFVLESGRWPDLQWPADLYLEGSDQHRGWFQSSLLQSCATRGRAPYDQILTHGFTMDAKGRKMSKSEGNTIDPLKVMETYGADIIRLWALSVDFTEDHRIGDEILKGVGDQYRKLRNTFRYLLGALVGFSEAERVTYAAMPELERYILGKLHALDGTLHAAIASYDFNEYVRALVDFCNEDLSAFFFDIRKDSLYCDDPADTKRMAYRTVLDILFERLIRYAAPVLVFTAEEVWTSRYPDSGSVHLLELDHAPEAWADEALAAKWDSLRALRDAVNEAIEPLRRDKTIRSSLEAEVTVPAAAVPEGVTDEALAELFITATVTRGQGEGVTVAKSHHHKCGRCWRLLPDVAEDGALCGRCDAVVAGMDASASA